jgi:hypothetical protein
MYNSYMRTNIDLNDELVAEAMRATGARTKREVVERALVELVARNRRPSIAGLLGLGGIDPGYDHKATRGGAWLRVEEPRSTYGASVSGDADASDSSKEASAAVPALPKRATDRADE